MSERQTKALAMVCIVTLAGCAGLRMTPYELSSPEKRSHFKRVIVPLAAGTSFRISQGAFGQNTHYDLGHEYTWDFDVPYGTEVLSVESGIVTQVREPLGDGGCDPKFNDTPHSIQIQHDDGTVAQYVHVQSRVKVGERVFRGQTVAITAKNGFICTPQLDFGIYRDRNHIPGSVEMKSIPLLFIGFPDGGMAHEGYEGKVSTD